jgi:hypothetical protein
MDQVVESVRKMAGNHPIVVGIIGLILGLYVVSVALAPSFNYEGKHVMITGGSSGIGLEVSE